MVREDETDEEVYHRYLRVKRQAVPAQQRPQQQVRSFSSLVRNFGASNVIPIELWRDRLARRWREKA